MTRSLALRLLFLLTSGAILTTIFAASQTRAAAGGSPQEQEVRAFLAHYLKALEEADEAAIRPLYVVDERLSWFTDGALAYRSVEEVLAGRRRYAGTRFVTEASEVRVLCLSDRHASVDLRFLTRLSIPQADDVEFSGVITLLLEKQDGEGRWQVLVGHTSTPGGPPASDED